MEDIKTIVIYVVLSLAAIALSAFIFSLFFGMKRLMWYQDRQIDLLSQIAKNTGSSHEDIKQIVEATVTRDNGLPSPLALIAILFVVGIVITVCIVT